MSRDDSVISLSKQSNGVPRRRTTSVSSLCLKKVLNKKKKVVNINDYHVIRTLGKGSFAKVLLCQRPNGQLFALKQMSKRDLKRKMLGPGRTAYDAVLEELKVLQQLEHPNIIWLEEVIDDP